MMSEMDAEKKEIFREAVRTIADCLMRCANHYITVGDYFHANVLLEYLQAMKASYEMFMQEHDKPEEVM